MKRQMIVLSGLLLCILFVGCKRDRFQIKGEPKTWMQVVRFDQTFHETGRFEDTAFLELYANDIMQIGASKSLSFYKFSEMFRNDTDIQQIYDDCQVRFEELSALEAQLSWGFYRLSAFVPSMPAPSIYAHISGMGSSIVTAPGMASISLDKYLGSSYALYASFFEPYQVVRMRPEGIAPDLLQAWVRSEYPTERYLQNNRLLDFLIYEGKIHFITHLCLPEIPLHYVFGFTEDQLNWCKAHEATMWETLLEQQHLYTTDPATIGHYIHEAPYTRYFPETSPGRATLWIGYQIVQKYVEKNKKVKIEDLLFHSSTTSILTASGYQR